MFRKLKDEFLRIGTLIYSNVELSEETNETKGNEDINKASALPDKRGSYACPTVVKFSSDGRRLVYGLYDGRVIVRSVDSWQKELALNAHEGFVTGIVLLSDGRRIITSSIDGSLIMHDLDNGEELKRWKPAESYVPVFSMGITRDENYLVADTYETRILDVSSLNIIRVFPEGHPLGFISVVTPDSKRCFMCSEEHPISLWEIETVKRLMTLKNKVGEALSLALTSDGRYLIVGNINGTIDLWDAETGNKLKTMKGHTKRIVSITVCSDNKYLVSGAWDKTAKIWDIDSGTLIKSIEAHDDNVNSVAISPDDRYIASGGDDGAIKVWGTWKESHHLFA